jgi:hypothetical protein
MSLYDAAANQRDMEMTDHPNATPRRVREDGSSLQVPAQNRNRQLDALENLFKMLDTPIARRKLGTTGMMSEAMEEAEKVLRENGRV